MTVAATSFTTGHRAAMDPVDNGRSRDRRPAPMKTILLLALIPLLPGCAVVSVAGAAAGAAISVTGAVVTTGVKITGKAIELAIPGDDDDEDD